MQAEGLLNLDRVLMFFSNSYDGPYPRELAHGFSKLGIRLGIASLSGVKKPTWTDNYSVDDFSDIFQGGKSFFCKFFLIRKVIKEFKPSVVQTHLFEAGILGLMAAKLTGVPVIVTRHHIDEHYQSGTFVHRWLDRTTAKLADHVIVCSRAAKEWLTEVESVLPTKVTVINQGFDFSYLNPTNSSIHQAKLEIGLRDDRVNIVCIARYSRVKGQDFLLHAFGDLLKKFPKLTLTFMGPGDSRWLRILVEELDLGEFINLLPARNDVPACIAAADIVIHPSLADSFSQLVIEAQAAGGLLIASDIAAVREQVIDGETGIIIPPRDPEAIKEAVEYVLTHPEEAKLIRMRARTHVRASFPWERMIEEEVECLEKTINLRSKN